MLYQPDVSPIVTSPDKSFGFEAEEIVSLLEVTFLEFYFPNGVCLFVWHHPDGFMMA